uniref:Uncharacterized protein n=1 Tax=Rhizophora mucronata TaxID=61149 RepID=A0A2P2IRA8_RHIMU
MFLSPWKKRILSSGSLVSYLRFSSSVWSKNSMNLSMVSLIRSSGTG